MTKIMYKGCQYIIADWVKYVSEDRDGAVYGFEFKPTVDVNDERWVETTGRNMLLRRGFGAVWRNSLTKASELVWGNA